MEEDQAFDDISLEDLVEGLSHSLTCATCYSFQNVAELPENAPRYVLLSYELSHSDGRVSYPLVLINWAPTTAETGLLTLHASALIAFQNAVSSFPGALQLFIAQMVP